MFSKRKFDIGLAWATIVNVWGQAGLFAGVANLVATLAIWYTVSFKTYMSGWLYILIILVCCLLAVGFIVKIGISGYYRFFNKQSALERIERRQLLIMKHLGITDDEQK